MTFYTYMIRNYFKSDSPEGNLAEDMKRDKKSFPRNGQGKYDARHKLIYEYLEGKRACSACLDTFDKCWEKYVRCEKKRLNRS